MSMNDSILLQVTPPRTGERTLLGVELMLQTIASPEPFALELASTAEGLRLLVRCKDQALVQQQVRAHYSQSEISEVPPIADPLHLRDGEQAWTINMDIEGPSYLPLRTFRDDDLLDQGSDPFIGLAGALSELNPGERIVTRLKLHALAADWSKGYLAEAYNPKNPKESKDSKDPNTPEGGSDIKPVVALLMAGVAGLAGVKSYQWWQEGEFLLPVVTGLGVAGAAALALWVKKRFFSTPARHHDPILMKEKVSRAAFAGQLQITAVLPDDEGSPELAQQLLDRMAGAYRAYDNPAGSRIIPGRVTPMSDTTLEPVAPGLLTKPAILGVREVASLWHPPGSRDETPFLERAGAKMVLPPPSLFQEGAAVGATTQGVPRPVHFPLDLLQRNHLYVARTRMGKSTLMQHQANYLLQEKAAGRNRDALIVIDPHSDLVDAILAHLPPSLVDEVKLIDLANPTHAPGINLLDTHVFTDRDRAADSVVRVARSLWEQWGPRMQSILEHTVKTLHEANSHPSVAADRQYTILDARTLLVDLEFRSKVLARLEDSYLLEWWLKEFGGWNDRYRSEALAPVQGRLSYYASSKKARAILGQPRSTIDLRSTILDGGILLVSTAQGVAGRDVAGLVGSSILNLIDAVIREQETLPPAQRRGVHVIVDEMQTLPGADYEGMLSELQKYGARFTLATQSLAKLHEVSPSMQDVILANSGCLAVFQAAGTDARRLLADLGQEQLTEEDITSLPAFHCYVRATVENRRVPVFSMKLAPPTEGNPDIARRVREASRSYTTANKDIDNNNEAGKALVAQFRKDLEKRQARAAPLEGTNHGGAPGGRRGGRRPAGLGAEHNPGPVGGRLTRGV